LKSETGLEILDALDRVGAVRDALAARGFHLSEDELPVRFVLTHASLGQIDFHPVTFDAAGDGLQAQPDGSAFRYPREGLVSGSIGDRSVRCITAEVQVLCHRGYEPTEKDRWDLDALRRAFGVALREPHSSPDKS
jgi:lincosamide nucleotidyltransferase A/C/D/E